MEERYRRNFPALTEKEQETLKSKRILIVGCGGLGGFLLELMLRIGVGTIRICDGDCFEETNLNRQLLADVSNLGQRKAKAAALRARLVNPTVTMEVVDTFLTRENAQELIRDCDAVLDGLDSIESRKLLYRACEEAGIPCIYGAVGGWIAQAAVCMPGEHLLDTLYPEGAVAEEKSVLSFTASLCASLQAALCVRLLAGQKVETGILYCFDLQNQELEIFPQITRE